MARKRSQKDTWIPPYVNRGKSAWEFRPKGGPCVRLCALDSPKALVLRRHAEEFERLTVKEGSFTNLVERFLKSPQFLKLAPTTQKDYQKYWKKIEPVFGKTDARRITPQHIRKYMDRKGQSSEVQANRHHSFMSKVFSWGYERGDVNSNPCKGVEKFTETPRERYIEDWEYNLVFENAPGFIRAAMEISYLCGARQGDVLKLKKSDLLNDGIFIRQGKTGKKQIKAWTPRLRKAVAMAKRENVKVESMYVIPNQSGVAYTSDGFRTMWSELLNDTRKESGKPLDFTFHDIKAKGISDFEGNQAEKQEFSGHKTPRQLETYDRKVKVVPTLKKD